MTYFFFGTLMDRDVLAAVLDRPVASGELSRAWLRDYQRVRAATAPYPILVPAPGVVVGGVVFRPRSVRDDVRIQHFEEGEYVEHWLLVHPPGGRGLLARVFLALEVLGRTSESWHFNEWAHEHKAAFLEQCRDWMLDCPGSEHDRVADPSPETKVAAGWLSGRPRR
jgi:hypothetical protein